MSIWKSFLNVRKYLIWIIKHFDKIHFSCHRRVNKIISRYGDCHSVEVQQRSVEYCILLDKHSALRPGVLEPMPKFEKPAITMDEENRTGDESSFNGDGDEEDSIRSITKIQESPAPQVR